MDRLLVVQHIDREGPSLFIDIAEEYGLSVSIAHVYKGDPLPLPDKYDLLLILGGPMGISDLMNPTYKWLIDEIDLIKYVLESEVPFIGVCLGAQLLAYVAGGSVTTLVNNNTNKPSPEVGWSPINFVEEFSTSNPYIDIRKEFYALHWHGDRILLPEQAILLASSSNCKEQMFTIGTKAYGLQFHIEVDNSDVERWIIEDKEFIESSLGVNAVKILIKQNKLYCNSTKNFRMYLIRSIFADLLGMKEVLLD